MQPHEPYIGEWSSRIETKIQKVDQVSSWEKHEIERGQEEPTFSEGITHIEAAMNPDLDVSDTDIRNAYYESLELTLENIEEVIHTFDGKIVISADHGELLGDTIGPFGTKRYGHPVGLYVPELRRVPWLIIDGGQRPEITADPPVRYDEVDEENVESKLEALGYK
jgi:hypothetical protein